MSYFLETAFQRMEQCLAAGTPCALIQMPSEDTCYLFDTENNYRDTIDGAALSVRLDVSPWLKRYADIIHFGEQNPAIAALPLEQNTTSQNDYLDAVSDVIKECRRRNSKTVFSRVITGSAHRSFIDVAKDLFTAFPETYRFLLYSPELGGWLGASPETLVDIDFSNRQLRTVALAGTRQAPDIPQPWDRKNIEENRYVIDFLLQSLRGLGLEAEATEPVSVAYGSIEHLCSTVKATFPADFELSSILNTINPTPALCGFPRREAIESISRHEKHPRHLYGGFLALETFDVDGQPLRYHAFVALRCLHFRGSNYCIYTGGGITPLSDPATEYTETIRKSQTLRRLVEN